MKFRTVANKGQAGLSMIEMLINLAIVSVVVGSILPMITRLEGIFQNTSRTVDMHGDLRGAISLIEQEVTQAGLLTFASRTTSAAITHSAIAQAVTLSTVSAIYVGEKLMFDTGSSQEVVAVTAVNTGTSRVTGIFTKDHASGAAVNALGVFPAGILSTSTATQLQMFGDINGTGTLVYVQYDCTAPGSLTRSSTPITAGSISTAAMVVDNLVANPGATPCFQYGSTTNSGFTFITMVSVTLTLQTAKRDMQTGVFATITKSMPNLTPRNVVAGLQLAQASVTDRLQPTPPGLPLH